MSIEIIEHATDTQIADWIADKLQIALQIATPGPIAIAVPGGTTPFPILAQLAQRDIAWHRVSVWAGDDRVVSEEHPASNIGRIRALLEPVGAMIVPLTEAASPPHFTLVWLGMGGDGHIASLFPNTDPQADDPQMLRRITPDPLPPEAPFDRLSLTIPALCHSQALLFVIRGADKRAVFEAAMLGANDLPIARLLHAQRPAVTCFV